MEAKKAFTIGEIFRLGLLRNHKGEAYAHRATLSKVLLQIPHGTRATAHGTAKVVEKVEIDKWNARWEKL